MLDLSQAYILERGDNISEDVAGFDYVTYPIIGHNLFFCISFIYKFSGQKRIVVIDSIAGNSLNDIKYIRGFDSHYKEYRTYAVDKISHLHSRNGDVYTKRIPWILGSVIRRSCGLDITIPAFSEEIHFPVILSSNQSGTTECFPGNIYQVRWAPGRDDEPGTLIASFNGRHSVTGKSVLRRVRLLPLRPGEVCELLDVNTHETIEYPISELARACGLTVNGVEPDFDITAALDAIADQG